MDQNLFKEACERQHGAMVVIWLLLPFVMVSVISAAESTTSGRWASSHACGRLFQLHYFRMDDLTIADDTILWLNFQVVDVVMHHVEI